MPITNRPSVSAFNSSIRESKKPSGNETTGKLTSPEMKRALKSLPETTKGAAAAQDLMDSGIVMTDAARSALKGFIRKTTGAPSMHGTGATAFADVSELRSALKSNPSYAADVFRSAFGSSTPRSSSSEVVDVRAAAAGGFEVDVEMVHWQTRAVMKSATVAVSDAGVVEGPVTPAASELQLLRDDFADTGFAREMATKALADAGLGGLTRSDAVHVGDVTDGPMGSFFVDVNVSHFMNANDVRAELRLQMDHGGGFMGASERASGGGSPVAPTPAPSAPTGAQAIADKLSDAGAARDLATAALADLGIGGLSRSDAVHVGDVTDGPMGSYFVDVNVSHFMNANDVRAEIRVQLDFGGGFMGASERTSGGSSPVPPAPAPSAPTGAQAISDKLSDVGVARDLATAALQDIGIGGLSRSDAVHVGDVTDGPMGSYFVDVNVSHFMNANDVRAALRLQLNHAGDFVGAREQ